MEDRTKKLLIGGAALLGGALCGWLFYEKRHPHLVKRSKSISKSLWIQILKDQEREFYSILKLISELSKDYLERLRQANMLPTPEAMQQALFKDCKLPYEY